MPKSRGDLVALFKPDEVSGPDLKPSWNVAPTQQINLIRERYNADGEHITALDAPRWGLVPFWAKDLKAGARAINARFETVTEKPTFRNAAVKRRGIVPAEGYYEWMKNQDGTKTPIYLHAKDEDSLLNFAALYEFWPDPSRAEDDPDKWVMTATILTRDAHDSLGQIHDRCPVIIPADLQKSWLDPLLDGKDDVRELLAAIPEPHLVPREVDPRVGSVRNNGPELIEPVKS